MMKNTIWCRGVCTGLALLLAALLSGCSALAFIGGDEPADTAFFEGELMQRVPNKGDSASIGEPDLNHVTSVQFALGVFEDTRVTLRDEASIREVLGFVTGAVFTRLYGPDDEWDRENEQYQRVNEIMGSGLVLHYTVDFRPTMGAFYVSPEGQAVWFTGDETAVLLTEPGSVDYDALVSWLFRYRYDVDLGGLMTEDVTGGN